MVGIQRDALVHDLPSDRHPGVAGMQVLQGKAHPDPRVPPAPSTPNVALTPISGPQLGSYHMGAKHPLQTQLRKCLRSPKALGREQGRHLARRFYPADDGLDCSLGPHGPRSGLGTCRTELNSGDSIPIKVYKPAAPNASLGAPGGPHLRVPSSSGPGPGAHQTPPYRPCTPPTPGSLRPNPHTEFSLFSSTSLWSGKWTLTATVSIQALSVFRGSST